MTASGDTSDDKVGIMTLDFRYRHWQQIWHHGKSRFSLCRYRQSWHLDNPRLSRTTSDDKVGIVTTLSFQEPHVTTKLASCQLSRFSVSLILFDLKRTLSTSCRRDLMQFEYNCSDCSTFNLLHCFHSRLQTTHSGRCTLWCRKCRRTISSFTAWHRTENLRWHCKSLVSYQSAFKLSMF